MALERRSDVIGRLETELQASPLSLRAGRFVPLGRLGGWELGRVEATHGGPRGRVYVLSTSGESQHAARGGSVYRVEEPLDVVVSELHDGRVLRIDQKLGLLAFGETVTRELFDGLGDSWWPTAALSVRDSVEGDAYELVVPGRLSYLHELEA